MCDRARVRWDFKLSLGSETKNENSPLQTASSNKERLNSRGGN